MKGMLIILDVKLGRHVLSSSGDKMSKFSAVYRIVALVKRQYFFLMEFMGRSF